MARTTASSASFGGFQLIGPSAVQTIPASSNGFPLTVQWNPTQASDHECLLCRLSSTANGTTFINAGEFINSAVAAMSTATLEPRLSMKGVRPRKGGGPQKVRLSTQARFQFAFADGKLAEIPAGTLVAQLDWVFLVAHDTGLTITILENPIPITEPLPSYSITLQHALLADFQKAFEERHQKELAVFLRERNAGGEGMGPIVYRRANEILARVEEKPNPADFKTEVKGVTPVANSGSMLYDVEIPEGGEIVVPTTGTYVGGGGVCQSCWCCLQTKSTPAFAFISFGLIMFVGVFAYRRRT